VAAVATAPGSDATITEDEAAQVERANGTGRTPVVFVHGLWLLPNSWDRWSEVFEAAGYTALTPGWPDDPDTVAEAQARPEVFAGKTIKQIADHMEDVIRRLTSKPVVIGHSFGGLLTQILAGRGLSRASVAIDPAPFRGVLPLPISALRSGGPVLRNPRNRHRAVPLTYDQFRYSFANAVPEEEAKSLFETYAVPGPANRSSRPPPPTSTRGRRPRSTQRTPSAARSSSSSATRTTRPHRRSPRRLTTARSGTLASPSSL
jgi:pimeloyl-ACP methyl ester carboxylesterase